MTSLVVHAALGILTVAPTAAGRGWTTEWLQQWLKDPARPRASAEWHLEPDFHRALAQVQEGAGTVLVTGSFHTVGDVMLTLGLAEVTDHLTPTAGAPR